MRRKQAAHVATHSCIVRMALHRRHSAPPRSPIWGLVPHPSFGPTSKEFFKMSKEDLLALLADRLPSRVVGKFTDEELQCLIDNGLHTPETLARTDRNMLLNPPRGRGVALGRAQQIFDKFYTGEHWSVDQRTPEAHAWAWGSVGDASDGRASRGRMPGAGRASRGERSRVRRVGRDELLARWARLQHCQGQAGAAM